MRAIMFPDRVSLGERETARAIGVSARQLFGMRQRGEGPPHVRIGKRVLYRLESLNQWLAARESTATAPSATGASA